MAHPTEGTDTTVSHPTSAEPLPSRVGGYFVVVPPGATYGSDVIGKLVRTLLMNWLPLLLGAMLGGVAALALSFIVKPTYRAEVIMVAADDDQSEALKGSLGSLASLAGIGAETGAKVQESLAVLESFEFTAGFIAERNMLSVLFPDDYTSNGAPRSDDSPTMQDAVELFHRKISRMAVDEDQGVFRLRVYWKDPVLAAEWANGLVESLNERMRLVTMAESDRNIQFLQKELDATSAVELRHAISQLTQRQLEKRMMASVHKQYVFRVIDPARIADEDKYVRPSHLLFAILGVLGGVFVAAAWVLRRRPA